MLAGSAVACVPEGRDGYYLGGGAFVRPQEGQPDAEEVVEPPPVPIDGGFTDAGQPIDGGFADSGTTVARRDASADAGTPASDTGTTPPRDGGVTPPRDGGVPPRMDASAPVLLDAAVVDRVYDNCTAFSAQIDVPITVNDTANTTIQRDPAVTSFLVPFARSANVLSLNALLVYDQGGNRLPAQFEVLSRWNGADPSDCMAPIRFAYAFVRATPPAGQSVVWHVRNEPGAPGETTTMSIVESAQQWVIDTGAARFTIRRDRFEGLSKVELTGGSAPVTVSDLSGMGFGQAGFLVDHGGVKSSSGMAPWYTALERSGKQVATIAARGYYTNATGQRDLAYTVRLNFYAGSAMVRVEHTYYHGEVNGWSADQASNTTQINRAWMRIPLAGQASGVAVRGVSMVHQAGADGDVRIEQQKRGPSNPAMRFQIDTGAGTVESGTSATAPFLAVSTDDVYALATIARMNVRDPQGLRWDPSARALDVDFTSTVLGVGGARGIWSIAAIDFGRAGADYASRGTKAQLLAERPLLGAPQPGYVNNTQTIGPYAVNTARFTGYFNLMQDLHNRTREYLGPTKMKITGLQIWPDLTRLSCDADFNCDTQYQRYFEGGDNNYWNWSKNGIDEFFRTGRNDFIYDFSLGEAITFAETLAIRTYHDQNEESSVTGLAPCYGSSRGFGGPYREGGNNRTDNCPADYTYNKSLYVAFLATGDRRFVDYWDEAATNVITRFGDPPPTMPDGYLEVTMSRLSAQRLEHMADAAEFSKDRAVSARVRRLLRTYVDTMLGNVLVNGHSCDMGGSGSNSALRSGRCVSAQAWMMPVVVDWTIRVSRLLDHQGLAEWVIRHGQVAAQQHAVVGANGLPDFSRRQASSGDNSQNGWRTVYTCSANANGVDESTCRKVTNIEANGYFYENGLIAFLNVFGLVLSADNTDPNRVCQWLPSVYAQQAAGIANQEINYRIWGKAPGEAFNMSAEAVGALSRCP